MLLEQPEHSVANMRRVIVRDDGLARALRQGDFFAVGQGVGRVHQHHELILAEDHCTEARFSRLEREDTEIEASLGDLGADLTRRNTPDVDMNQRVGVAELRDDRQHHVHRGFIGADQHASAAEVAQVADRAFSLLRQAQQAFGVLTKQATGLGQGSVFRGAVEQPFADRLLETPDGLTDRRLRTVQFHRGA